MPDDKCPPTLRWDKPMTSGQAAKYLLTKGFVALDLYRALRAKLQEAERERDGWRKLAEARAELMAYWRTGRRPTETVLQKLDKAKAALAETPAEAPAGQDKT